MLSTQLALGVKVTEYLYVLLKPLEYGNDELKSLMRAGRQTGRTVLRHFFLGT
jgi:hypothetical protein